MKNLILTLIITLPLTLWGQEWTKTFGGLGEEYGSSVQQTTDGGFIITGRTNSFGFSNDVYLIKTYENGVEQWSKTFGESENDNGNFVQQTTDGGFIIIGNTNSFSINNGSEIWLIKTDENGEEQWNQTFGGVEQDYGKSVQQTIDGGFIIIGQTESFGNGGRDVYLIKTDENGIEQWSKIFNENEVGTMDYGTSVQQTNDGGYIVTGFSYSTFSVVSFEIILFKTDVNGNNQWNKSFDVIPYVGDYEHYDEGCSVQQTTDGGYIITGVVGTTGDGNEDEHGDLFLIKTDGQGNISSTFEIPLPNPNRKLEK
ncbi:MAG: hypothetical protein ACON5E_01385, partial [Flavobacteriales bacterium]